MRLYSVYSIHTTNSSGVASDSQIGIWREKSLTSFNVASPPLTFDIPSSCTSKVPSSSWPSNDELQSKEVDYVLFTLHIIQEKLGIWIIKANISSEQTKTIPSFYIENPFTYALLVKTYQSIEHNMHAMWGTANTAIVHTMQKLLCFIPQHCNLILPFVKKKKKKLYYIILL